MISGFNKSKQFRAGLKDALPVILGFIPVGIAYAIMARQAGFSVWQTCAMSLCVFAGASQIMAVGMYAQGASVIAMIVATFILNLRHLIMSVCVANRMQDERTALKPLISFGLTDESFAIFTTAKKEKCTAVYFLGLVVISYAAWVVGSAIGAVASDLLPPILTASLGIALYAMFIGLLVPHLSGNWRLAVLVVLTAVCNTVLTRFMDPSWALIVSTLVCAFLGVLFVDVKEDKREEVTGDGRN